MLKTAVAEFRRELRRRGDAAAAASQKAYMKSELGFHGVTVPVLRRMAAVFNKTQRRLPVADLRRLVDALFDSGFFDLRSLGLLLLERRRADLKPADLPWLLGLARQASCWAHVDLLATKVIGDVVARAPQRQRLLRRWARDRDLWVRRTALLAEHDRLRAGDGDFGLFAALAAPLLVEKEFFIRKAIGWVLREVSKKRPALVFAFLSNHLGQVSGLTLREGAKYLTRTQRAQLGLLR